MDKGGVFSRPPSDGSCNYPWSWSYMKVATKPGSCQAGETSGIVSSWAADMVRPGWFNEKNMAPDIARGYIIL